MSDVVKVVEVLAESSESWEAAARKAVQKASETLRNLRSIYIKEFLAEVSGDQIINYRVNAKISFGLE
jgi:dodecin